VNLVRKTELHAAEKLQARWRWRKANKPKALVGVAARAL